MKLFPIRVIAICIIRKNDAIFVFEGYDRVKKQTFYRPLGGGIEFKEHSSETIVREFQEELNTKIINLRYIQTIESIFTFEGNSGHEVVFVYEGDFADKSFYDKDVIVGEEDTGIKFKALWLPLSNLRKGQYPLYPDELVELLEKE
ncbi:MAG: NUDIX domain-containing protein [Chloroflexi bacterium]|nr:NUDIX domain-containing protein [Chloroflexota bacterium]